MAEFLATFARDQIISPLMIADQMLTLAEQTDRLGLRDVASDLVRLAHEVCDAPASPGFSVAESKPCQAEQKTVSAFNTSPIAKPHAREPHFHDRVRYEAGAGLSPQAVR